MTYPPVIQFETRALEAEAQARLARERRAAAEPRRRGDRWQPLLMWLALPRARARAAQSAPRVQSTLADCEQ